MINDNLIPINKLINTIKPNNVVLSLMADHFDGDDISIALTVTLIALQSSMRDVNPADVDIRQIKNYVMVNLIRRANSPISTHHRILLNKWIIKTAHEIKVWATKHFIKHIDIDSIYLYTFKRSNFLVIRNTYVLPN